MKTRFRLICRGIRGGAYYCVDTRTGKRTSLQTERFAQLALGHTSRAIHQACAKNAKVPLPPLEDYERMQDERKVIPLHHEKPAALSDQPAAEKDRATA